MPRLTLLILIFFGAGTRTHANPYLAKSADSPVKLRIATCALSRGFVHLYAAIDNGLFAKYRLKIEHIYIQASAPSLAADEMQFL
jgi:hypothetical protein